MSTGPMRTRAELEAGLPRITESPRDAGALELIVRRPATEARETVDRARLDPGEGLVGDNWKARGSRRTADGSADPDLQIALINSRVARLVAGERDRWPLAGDQLYVDLDLSVANLPPGARIAIGDAALEVTAQPHLGCGKFAARFGDEAVRFVNSPSGRALRLRGANACIVRGGEVRTGDVVRRAGIGLAPVLCSERLRLHPVTAADTADLITHWSQPDVRRFLWDDELPEPAAVARFVELSVAAANASGYCLWRAERADDGSFVGVCGVRDDGGAPELVYSLEPDCWHRGYAREAALRVLAHCVGPLALPHMDASVDEPNVASVRTLERLGFARTARRVVADRPLLYYRIEFAQSK